MEDDNTKKNAAANINVSVRSEILVNTIRTQE